MDTSAPWRAIETPETGSPQPPPAQVSAGRPQLLMVAAGVLVAVSVAAAVLVAGQQSGQVEVVSGPSGSPDPFGGGPASPGGTQAMVVVEVTGAVAHPGVFSLPLGSRVADAIKAAGGYSPDVDPRQAEAQLNLAARLVDAEVVHVPRRGEAAASAASSGSGGARASPGLLNLNIATAAELDGLPGIGPVTAQKIIDARAQKPFASVQDLVARKIVSVSTLAKFRALVTVG